MEGTVDRYTGRLPVLGVFGLETKEARSDLNSCCLNGTKQLTVEISVVLSDRPIELKYL